MSEYLFVYGTLKSGEVNHHHWLSPYIKKSESDIGTHHNVNARKRGGKEQASRRAAKCCSCFIQLVGTGRTRNRYPFFTNTGIIRDESSSSPSSTVAGLGVKDGAPQGAPSPPQPPSFIGISGSCSPCVVDVPIHDDDLARVFVPDAPKEWGCSSTIDPMLHAMAQQEEEDEKARRTVGHNKNTDSKHHRRRLNTYYNNFPQRVYGEVYKIVRCAYCCSTSSKEKRGRENGNSVGKISKESENGYSVEVDEEDASQMMRDFDELEATREGVYTRRPVKVEVLLRSEHDLVTAMSAGVSVGESGNTAPSLLSPSSPNSPNYDSIYSGGSPSPASTAQASPSPTSSISLSQRMKNAFVSTAANILFAAAQSPAASLGISAVSPSGSSGVSTGGSSVDPFNENPLLHHGRHTTGANPGPSPNSYVHPSCSRPSMLSPPSLVREGAIGGGRSEDARNVKAGDTKHNNNQYSKEPLLPTSFEVTAHIYFRTGSYPRDQLIEMLKRALSGPTKAKIEAKVEPLKSQSPTNVSSAAGAANTPALTNPGEKVEESESPSDHSHLASSDQPLERIQGFLSNFSAAKSLILSYPTHFSYVPPHLRRKSKKQHQQLTATTDLPSTSHAIMNNISLLLRQLPPSVLRSGGRLPPPIVFIVLDGLGDYSGYTLASACDNYNCENSVLYGQRKSEGEIEGVSPGGDGSTPADAAHAQMQAQSTTEWMRSYTTAEFYPNPIPSTGGQVAGKAANDGGHGHGDCLPTRVEDTHLLALPRGLVLHPDQGRASFLGAPRYSPLEMVSLLHLSVEGKSEFTSETNKEEAQARNVASHQTNSSAKSGNNKVGTTSTVTTSVIGDGIHVITRNGWSGMMDPHRQGHACGSDTAHLNLLGFDPLVYYRGRGSFETIGSGLSMIPGDIAFKCNFATMAHIAPPPPAPTTVSPTVELPEKESIIGSSINADAEEQTKDGEEAFFSSPTSTPIVINRRADRDFTREGPILCEALNGLVVDKLLDGKAFTLAEGGGDPSLSALSDFLNNCAKQRQEDTKKCEALASMSFLQKLFSLSSSASTKDGSSLSSPSSTSTSSSSLKYQVLVKYATEHRCGVVIRGPNLSDAISGTDPLVNNKPLIWCTPTAKKPDSNTLDAEIYSKFRIKVEYVGNGSQKEKELVAGPSSPHRFASSAKKTTIMSFTECVRELTERVQKIAESTTDGQQGPSSSFSGVPLADVGIASLTVIDGKVDLALSPTQQKELIEKEKALWRPYNEAVLTSAVANAASAAMTRSLMHHDINVLERLPIGKPLANVVLLRGAAQLSPNMPTFVLRHGMRAVAVAPTAIIKGLAKTAGFHILGETDADSMNIAGASDPIDGITGSYDSNLKNKATAVISLFMRQQVQFGRLFRAAFLSPLSFSGDGVDNETEEEQEQEEQYVPCALITAAVEKVIRKVRRGERSRLAAATSAATTTHAKDLLRKVENGNNENRSDDCDRDDYHGYDRTSTSGTAVIDMGGGMGSGDDSGDDNDSYEGEELVNLTALERLAAFVSNEMVDFAFVHVKGTDDAGHDKDLPKRVAMAFKAGEEVMKELWERMPVGTTLAVTADHTTPISMGDHTSECVPFSVAKIRSRRRHGERQGQEQEDPLRSFSSPFSSSSKGRAHGLGDGTPFFTEACCELYGSLGRFEGSQMLDIIKRVHDNNSI